VLLRLGKMQISKLKMVEKIRKVIMRNSFKPLALMKNPHLQTIIGVSSKFKGELKSERLIVAVDKGRVAVDCSWQFNREKKPTLIIMHGIIGNSSASYVKRLSYKAFMNGFNVVRVNLRGFGNTEHLSEKMYHAGQSNDLRDVISYLTKKYKLNNFYLLGFSLGGNLCLKFAGELNNKENIKGIACISPLIDLEVSWKPIEKFGNIFYRWIFIKGLKSLIRKKARLFPSVYDLSRLKGLNTIRDFDERYQAPLNNFKDATDYYKKTSAIKVISRIRTPTLIIHSHDDTITPYEPLIRKEVRDNPYIIALITHYGGHVGFLSRDKSEDRYWAENRAIEFFKMLEAQGF